MEMLNKITEIVREAGKIVLSAHDIENQTRFKTSAADMVTAYDVKVENFLKERLPELMPGAVFYGEEEKENTDPTHGWAFVVDPIDGTANFVRDLHNSAISVALAKDGQVEYGVVFNPYRDEMFTAKRGCGAFLNGQPIHVSTLPLSRGIFAVGTAPYNSALHPRTMNIVKQLFERSCDLRRMGSAALDLCSVACGRVELYFECELSPWDYAAGSLLVTEAGGNICTVDGRALTITGKNSVWAANAENAGILKEISLDEAR